MPYGEIVTNEDRSPRYDARWNYRNIDNPAGERYAYLNITLEGEFPGYDSDLTDLTDALFQQILDAVSVIPGLSDANHTKTWSASQPVTPTSP